MVGLVVELLRDFGGKADRDGSSRREWELDRLTHGGRGLAITSLFQCSLTWGSVRRVSRRARVPSVVLNQPCRATSCILYNDRYISRAK
jgi:hypothetical protein